MKDLIEALQILSKYTDDKYPTWCNHDEFNVNVDPESVSIEDIKSLEDLSFCDNGDGGFVSFKYGSC